MLNKIIFITVFVASILLFAQKKPDSVIINSGYIDPQYFPINNLKLPNEHKLNVTNFKKQKYPLAFRFKFSGENRLRNEFLFIDGKNSFLTIDAEITTCSKSSNSGINNEYINQFVPFYYGVANEKCTPINSKIYENNNEVDLKLQVYIKNNPSSFVALWHLIEQVSFNGYSIERERSKDMFSITIKKNILWKKLDEDIKSKKIYSIGNIFPKFDIKDLQLKKMTLKLSKEKYIFIDIWTSSCMPCIESFPKLKSIYSKYNKKGLEIIGISANSTSRISSWKKSIEQNSLPWINYLDENGVETRKRYVNIYPTTFLLDSEGKIIKRDITPEELEIFLDKNLK